MTDKLEYKGFWWIPGQVKKIPGELKVDTDGIIVLEVQDQVSYVEFFQDTERKNKLIPVLHGIAKHRQSKRDSLFTLFNLSISGYSISQFSEFKFQVKFYIQKRLIESEDKIQIKSAFLRFQLLDDWIDTTGFKGFKVKAQKKFKVALEYEQPKPITLLKNKDFHIYLWFWANQSRNNKEYKIEEKPMINIEFKKKHDYNDFKKLYEVLKNFISFCTGFAIKYTSIEFYEFSNREIKKEGLSHQSALKLEISDSRYSTKRETLQSNLMILNFKDLNHSHNQILSNWIEFYKTFEPALKKFFDTIYNPDLYTENAFLNYVSALETYHRIKYPSFNGKDSRYDKVLKRVLSQLKQNERDWTAKRLAKKNEISLFSRLLHLTGEKSILHEDPHFFSEKVANTRHYFTHFSDNDKEKAATDTQELRGLTNKVRVLMQIQILKELGFSDAIIENKLKKAMVNWSCF